MKKNKQLQIPGKKKKKSNKQTIFVIEPFMLRLQCFLSLYSSKLVSLTTIQIQFELLFATLITKLSAQN